MYSLQNFYKQTVTQNWTSGAGTFYLSVKPTVSSGILVVSPNSATFREIIKYTSTGTDATGDYVVVASAGDRGLGGTTAQTHSINEPVRMNLTAEHIADINADITSKYGAGSIIPTPVLATDVANKAYIDGIAIAGAPNASTTAKGIVELATTAEIDAETANGSTGAAIVVTPDQLATSKYGFLVRAQSTPNMTVAVKAFSIAELSYAGGNTSTIVAPVTNPRIDLVVLTSAGTLAVRAGTEAVTPVASTPTDGDIVLAKITLATSTTTITNALISNYVLEKYQVSSSFDIIFGDGSDGDVTISSNTTISRDMYYNNLTINSGFTLNPSGYRVFVKNTFTTIGTGKLARNGNNGSNGAQAVAGAGGLALAAGTIYGSDVGGQGGLASNGIGGTSSTNSIGTLTKAGDGGNDNISPFYLGGIGGTSVATTTPTSTPKLPVGLLTIFLEKNGVFLTSSSSGGGGASSSNASGNRGGGGGGTAGGIILLVAKNIILSANNSITALGGNGGNGGNSVGLFDGSGGGGGNGGVIILVYKTISGTTLTASSACAGGAAGLKGTGGTNGTNGNAGTVGVIYSYLY